MSTTLQEISAIIAFIALLVSLLLNAYNFKAKIHENSPDERRMKEIEKRLDAIDQDRKNLGCAKLREVMQETIYRNSSVDEFNTHLISVLQSRLNFERVILASIRTLVDAMPEGVNFTGDVKSKIKNDIDQYLFTVGTQQVDIKLKTGA